MLALILRFALSALVALAAFPAASQTAETNALVNAYYLCIGKAAGRDTAGLSSNPEATIERAFLACQTEELAIRAWCELRNIPPAQIDAIIATFRARSKARLSSLIEKLTE
jgi:hypothetical protein